MTDSQYFQPAPALKHSAGPWAAKKLSGSYADPGWVVLWPDKSKPGVHMRRIDWQGQMTEADAKLVAAAPEMLETIRIAIGNVRSLGPAGALDGIPYTPYRAWLAQLEDAFAKATGAAA